MNLIHYLLTTVDQERIVDHNLYLETILFNYMAAAVAALTLSSTSVAAQDAQPQVAQATCTAIMNGEQGNSVACQVMVVNSNGRTGVAYSATGNPIIFIGVMSGETVVVDTVVIGEDSFEGTGSCKSENNVVGCRATVGPDTLILKAAL